MNFGKQIVVLLILISPFIYTMQRVPALSQENFKTLKKALNAFVDPSFYTSRTKQELGQIIDLASKAMGDEALLKKFSAQVKNFPAGHKKDAETIKEMLQEIIKRATKKINKKDAKKAQEQIKANAPVVKPIVLKAIKDIEQPEEIQSNRLYIGLDIKEHNANGQFIRWQDPIESMIAKMIDTEFIPNDYFHVTIAWYETKNLIAAELIARVEHILKNAAQILKIVFPQGVTGISLLDGAILLGNDKKSSVAFRVAESGDLKKLQEIILKFLSFDNIEGFKFSTFEKENPIHVTLGKIRPSKMGLQFQNVAAQLNAPEGTRASKGQSFIINTFRLTYSVAGQAWQEKMSYKF